jgi:hypothetical protein
MKKHLHCLLPALAAVLLVPGAFARPNKMELPDFTKGDPIPEGASHDWNLGATGARGWMFSDRLVTSDARQIRITKVDGGIAGRRVLAVGDVILGVGGKPFSYDPRTEFGKALTVAESEAGGGNLPLIRWRDGKTEEVVVKLPVLGTYSATAPYDCPKSKRILEQGCAALAKRIAEPDYRQNPITRRSMPSPCWPAAIRSIFRWSRRRPNGRRTTRPTRWRPGITATSSCCSPST